MDTINILSLPQIVFAHIYTSNTYENHFNIQKNLLEVSYLAEGSMTITVGDQIYHAKKHDVLCLSFSSKVSVHTDMPHCHHTIGATILLDHTENTFDHLLLPVITPCEYDTTTIRNIIDSLIQKQSSYKQSSIKNVTKYLTLLCEIDTCNRKATNTHLPSEYLYVQQAKDYVQKHIQEPIALSSVADRLGISSGYLCNIFKKVEGLSLLQYINRLKLENIKSLIDNKNMRLYEAAYLFGFTDPNYVSRLFKKMYGYNITDKPQIHL